MPIAKNKVVAIAYCLKNSEGKVMDSSDESEPLEYLHGYENVISGLEKELEGRRESDSFDVVIEPEAGYGEYDQRLVMEIPRANFPYGAQIAVGERFDAESSAGPVTVTVTRVDNDVVTVDANHPFAGMRLFFNVRVISVRDATQDEIARGNLERGCGECGGGCDSCASQCG
jgi:FKBP-type peptidyl-prolyl cis-trans isomerase SlyD